MARKRKKTQAVRTTFVEPSGNNANNRTKGNKMTGLTPDQIKGLLANSRTKGEYSEYLGDFIESGDAGVCANDEWVSLADRKDTTVKQGFENAKNAKNAPEGAENVKVIKNEGKVFLINLVVAGMGPDEVTDDDDDAAQPANQAEPAGV